MSVQRQTTAVTGRTKRNVASLSINCSNECTANVLVSVRAGNIAENGVLSRISATLSSMLCSTAGPTSFFPRITYNTSLRVWGVRNDDYLNFGPSALQWKSLCWSTNFDGVLELNTKASTLVEQERASAAKIGLCESPCATLNRIFSSWTSY